MFESILPDLYVFYSPNMGSNSYLLLGSKPVLVDTGIESSAALLDGALSTLGIKPNEISLILHTHEHADHFAADKIFYNAEIAMSESAAQSVNLHDPIRTCSALIDSDQYPKVTRILKDSETLDLKPFHLKVIYTPGHSKGSVCFYDKKNKILFSGDVLFRGSFGRYDLAGSDKSELIDSIKKLSKLDVDYMLPGHGLILRKNYVQNCETALEQLE